MYPDRPTARAFDIGDEKKRNGNDQRQDQQQFGFPLRLPRAEADQRVGANRNHRH